MCGICGILDYGKAEVKEPLLDMCRALNHRGPDGEGIYIDTPSTGPSLGLGHRRLKIIDLSEAGHQPMPNENKKVWVSFNGEIYNFRELKAQLINKGHKFISNTDTECVVHLYEEYAEDCVKYLRGMFAFAIWDSQNQSLMLARDRAGKKPLLYYHKDNKFCFASEFCSLLKSGFIPGQINHEAIDYYLSFGYIPCPLTIYKDVYKLPPAHVLLIRNNKAVIKKYWELNYKGKINISEQEAAGEVLRLLKESVGLRLYSDVPLGAFLSGGIDSSTIVALMSGLSAKKVKTFSIGFDDADYDELKYAKNIADKFATEHREFIVRPKALEILPLLVERYGEPYADSSCIPTYYVAKETRQYVTVALNGDGGDELFAGYERYQAMQVSERIPSLARKLLGFFSLLMPNSTNPKNKIRRIKRFLGAAALPTQARYLRWIGIVDTGLKRSLYSPDFSKTVSEANPLNFIAPFLDKGNGLSMIEALLFTDTMTYLPDDLLVKVDITSMANSLEARSPFLDHKLMEFAASLPSEYKMKNFVKKYILKKSIKGLIPDENIYRKKMGFGVPVGNWFRNELKGLLCETLLSGEFLGRGYFRPEAVNKMVNLHLKNKADYSAQLWALLMLELWHQRFKR